MTQIKDILLELNPWWKGGFRIEFKDRQIYHQIQKFLILPQIIALIGLRRVGKTTLMLKIVEDALKNGFNPKHIICFSFDEFKGADIREVLRVYEELSGEDVNHGKYLVLLDEIQKLNGWENQLKGLYDVFKKRVKFVISGSESLFIRKKSKETLAGRMFEFKVEPLSFKEFLAFQEKEFKPVPLYHKELMKLFKEFTLTLGFPELVGIKEKEVIKKYVQESIVEKVIYKDIPSLFSIKDVSVLQSILNILMEEPGQLIEISELAREMKISRQTLSSYLVYLEDSFLIRKLYNYSRSRRKVERKLKKYYPVIVSVDLLFKEDELSRSKIFEWILVNQLRAEFFWRDSYQNEVDIILTQEKPMPIEIKYGKLAFKSVLIFMKKFKVSLGYVISSYVEEKHRLNGKTIDVVPAYKFLLNQDKRDFMERG